MVSNYKKKNSLPLFVKSVAKRARNLNSNWKCHTEAESAIGSDSEQLDKSDWGMGMTVISQLNGGRLN